MELGTLLSRLGAVELTPQQDDAAGEEQATLTRVKLGSGAAARQLVGDLEALGITTGDALGGTISIEELAGMLGTHP